MSSPEYTQLPQLSSAQDREDLSVPLDQIQISSDTGFEPLVSSKAATPGAQKPSFSIRDKGSSSYSRDEDAPHKVSTWNRFRGPHSTWQTWTAADRDVATSLERLKAKDLSIHLYNAHALKAKAVRNQSKLAHSQELGDEFQNWQPQKSWTAWPMSSHDVPRESVDGWLNPIGDPDTFRSTHNHISSYKELQDVLIGSVTKIARERFVARQWQEEDKPPLAKAMTPEVKESHSTLAQSAPLRNICQGQPESSGVRSVKSTTGSDGLAIKEEDLEVGSGKEDSELDLGTDEETDASHTSSTSDSVLLDDEIKARPQRRRPRRHRASVSNSTANLMPVPLSDDAVTTQILTPSVNHLLSRLDTLLMGLHHARQAYLHPHFDSRSEASSGPSRAPSTESRRRRSNINSVAKGKRRTRSSRGNHSTSDSDSQHSPSADSTSEFEDSTVQKRGRSTQPKRSRSASTRARASSNRKARLGLRDWSDMLGIAAIQGWDPKIIEAARARCSALFEEDMAFKSWTANGKDVEISHEEEEVVASEDEIEGGVHVDGFMRPIKRRRGWRGKNSEAANERRRAKSKAKEGKGRGCI